MCCFNKEVDSVSKTKIFVMPTKNGRQVTVYDNSVSGGHSGRRAVVQKEKESAPKYGNAMILPCPLKNGADVALHDLSKDTFSFKRMKLYFPEEETRSRGMVNSSSSEKAKSQHLEVHSVGAYFISIAKNVDDLRRIDPTVFSSLGHDR